MFSKLYLLLTFVLALTLQAHGHAAIAPALGVSGTPARSDVQRPSTAKECGKINVASTLDTSTPVVAAADGSFTATISNFNAGKDGSRQVTAQVDATGAGTTFTAATVTTNGDLAPTDVGSQSLVVQLPAGTTCTGGAAGNLCLASFTTAGGFGNCVVVQQGGAAAVATNGTTTTTTTGTTTTGKKGKGKAQKAKAANNQRDYRAVGSRAARAIRRSLADLADLADFI